MAILVVVAYGVLAALLVSDFWNYERAGLQVPPRVAHRLVDVAAGMGRERAVNPVIAMAALEAGGHVALLELPPEQRDVLARTEDVFVGVPRQTLQRGLIYPFLGGRLRLTEYETELTAEQSAAIEDDPRVVRLPMDVWALPAEGAGAVVRLYTDPARLHIYLVPTSVIKERGWVS